MYVNVCICYNTETNNIHVIAASDFDLAVICLHHAKRHRLLKVIGILLALCILNSHAFTGIK